MFSFLIRAVAKYRVYVVVFWVLIAAGLFIAAPKLSEVGVTDESQFLPQNTESSQARALLKEKFPTADAPAATATIVFYKAGGLTEADIQSTKAARDWLASAGGPDIVTGTVSVFDNDALRLQLLSADRTTLLMNVNLSVSALDETSKSAVDAIRDYLHSHYADASADVTAYLTGETGFYQDLFQSVLKTISQTTFVTIALVAVLLLIVYRSPVAALLPLITIGCSYLVARGLLGYLAAAGMAVSTLADAYMIVVVFGIGTDYCLFMVSRYREELATRDRHEANQYAVRQIAPVIAASAATVVVAFLSMGVSRFGMTRTTGFALAIGVAVTLMAGLTLTPALMSLFGRFVFWPARSSAPRKATGGWSRVGALIASHPVAIAVPIILVLLIPYVALPGLKSSSDLISQMPQNAESVEGYKVMSEHFSIGEFSPAYVVVESPTNLLEAPAYSAVTHLADTIKAVPGVTRVDYFSGPQARLAASAAGFQALAAKLSQGTVDPLLTTSLQSAGQQLPALALQYPGVAASQNFQQAIANTTQAAALLQQLAAAPPASAPSLMVSLQTATKGLADSLQGLSFEFSPASSSALTGWLLSTYYSKDDTTTRLSVVLKDDPYSEAAQDTIKQVRQAAALSLTNLAGAKAYVGGDVAVRADIMSTNNADFGRVTVLTTAGVLVVIIILLRSLLAPLYMVATVLLNYGATLGVSTWLILNVLGHGSMIYMIPMFIFVVLVALGADYNIFLVSRIREEAERRPIKEAVARAVANTGGVITACGVILAGTFATLTTSPLQVVVQVGSAIGIGVLLDTFIVRALLVPSLATLAQRWSWWPSRLSRKTMPEPRPEK